MTMRIRPAVLVAALLLAPSVAQAVVVERVAAVVGEKAILLTEVRKRATPYLRRVYASLPEGPQRAGAESKIMKEILDKMVNEELEAVAANRQNTRVTAEEVDRALERIARASGQPLTKLYLDVEAKTGLSQADYRQEIRRQVLEGKLLNRFIQNQRVTPQEMRSMYDKVRAQERKVLLYQPAWIVLRLGKNPDPATLQGRMAEAQAIADRIRGGEDFAAVAEATSEDPNTSDLGGDLGIRVPSTSPQAQTGRYKMLAQELEQQAIDLERGEVSDPFRFKDALVVMTIVRRQPSRYETFEAVAGEMLERVRAQKLEKVKQKWLDDLRRRTYVDIRM